ncbi:MAG: hypothetical protein WBM44_30930, partial [Waterburya sp.]
MLKPLKDKRPLVIASTVFLLGAIGTVILTPRVVEWMEERQQAKIEVALQEDINKPSLVLT